MYRVLNITPFQKKSNYFLNKIVDVTIIVKTLEREEHLKNLLYSIRKLRFNGPIFIADDSRITYKEIIINTFPDLNIKYFELPYDSGTSIGRNYMLNKVTTKYFVLCDDDFIFESRTRIPLMLQILKNNKLDILGGVFREYLPKTKLHHKWHKLFKILLKFNCILPPPNIYVYHGNYVISGETCKLESIEYSNPFTVCDFTHNFFVAKTESIKKFGGWMSELKGGEHQNFFIRAKINKLRVATTTLCGVIHDRWTPNSAEYIELRSRGKDYQKNALDEFGIKNVVNYEEVTGGFFAHNQ